MTCKYFLTACAVIKDEGPYLREWLEFHRIQGVEHFYIWDNDSRDGGLTQAILREYEGKGLVTSNWVEWNPVQLKAYQLTLDRYGPETEWIAFIDADEFLYCTSPKRTLPQFLGNLSARKNISALAVRWYLYGSNGHLAYDDTLVTERFLRRQEKPNRHVKSIVRPEMVKVGANAHAFEALSGHIVDENGRSLPSRKYAVMEGGTADMIRINHYHVKSREEFERKRRKPRPSTGKLRPESEKEVFWAGHDLNEVFDASAAHWVNEITRRINDHPNNPNGKAA